jgi:NADPH:quinone reductase-like Zn-dependent oxidoreductase
MQALTIEAPNAPFQRVDVPPPVPGPGEALVRIHASGVNPLDAKIRAGAAGHARHPLPAILGIDLAGVIEAVGAQVTRFQPGDEVYGMTGGVGGVPGSLAEYAAVDAELLAIKPARLTMREAAALPLVAITAWEGLVDRAGVRADQRVLILGGAGGVGHIAIQIARARGAQVFATDRAVRAATIEQLGAISLDRAFAPEALLAEAARHAQAAGRGFDVVYDTVGGPALDAAFQLVRRFGHVVSSLGWGTHALAPLSFRAATYSGVFTLLPLLTGEGRSHHGEILAEIAALADAGQLAPRVDPRTFALTEADVDAAHAALTDGSAAGKLVISVQ